MSNLSAAIAWRYLIAKKTHSAVSAITAVSACGIAVATAAIICVLSVFNGFKSVIAGRLDTLSPDVMVTPAEGKVFASADSIAEVLTSWKEIEIAMPSVLDNALAIYNGHESPVSLKGVDFSRYARLTAVKQLMGTNSRYPETRATDLFAASPAILSIGAAARLGAAEGDGILIFAPRREGRVNIANPAASFLTDSVTATGIYQSNQQEYDDNRIIVDINIARDLLQYDDEASAIEILAAKGTDPVALASKVEAALGPRFIAKDRLRQQAMNFRMISIEKWVSFLLLFFILVIASFNIISSLSMLVLDKEKSMHTLAALGMSRRRIGHIFAWESIYVTFAGGICGVILGISLCLLQQHFGFIKLQGNPGDMIVHAYPVVVKATDILLTAAPILAIGLVTARITDVFARQRLSTGRH